MIRFTCDECGTYTDAHTGKIHQSENDKPSMCLSCSKCGIFLFVVEADEEIELKRLKGLLMNAYEGEA